MVADNKTSGYLRVELLVFFILENILASDKFMSFKWLFWRVLKLSVSDNLFLFFLETRLSLYIGKPTNSLKIKDSSIVGVKGTA